MKEHRSRTRSPQNRTVPSRTPSPLPRPRRASQRDGVEPEPPARFECSFEDDDVATPSGQIDANGTDPSIPDKHMREYLMMVELMALPGMLQRADAAERLGLGRKMFVLLAHGREWVCAHHASYAVKVAKHAIDFLRGCPSHNSCCCALEHAAQQQTVEDQIEKNIAPSVNVWLRLVQIATVAACLLLCESSIKLGTSTKGDRILR